MTTPHFNGPAYDVEHDLWRLSDQHTRVRDLMLDGAWRTIREIAAITGDPESSVSAQLRHLRKRRFGSYTVERTHSGDRKRGLHKYRVLPPVEGEQPAPVAKPDVEKALRLLERIRDCKHPLSAAHGYATAAIAALRGTP